MAVTQGVYVLNRDAPLTRQTITFPLAYTNTWTRGVSLRAAWKDIEPTEGSFDWSVFDNDIQAAVDFGKRVCLRVYTCVNGGANLPTWFLSSGALLFDYTSSNGGTQQCPVPWDTVWQTKWFAFLDAFATKYATHSQVDMIYMACVDLTGGEMHLTGATTATDVANWALAPYSYTPTKLINAWKAVIDKYVAVFPDKHLGLCVSTPISSTDNVVESVMDYAFATVSYGHLNVQHNALAKKTVVTGKPQTWVNRAKGENAIIFAQELCDASTAAGGDRWRGDTAGRAATLAEFQAGMAIGADYAQGPAVGIEAYPGNVGLYLQAGYDAYFYPPQRCTLETYDGSAIRKTKDGTTDLWAHFEPGDSGGMTQTGTLDTTNHVFVNKLTADPLPYGSYVHFFPNGGLDRYSYPNGYARGNILDGKFSPLTNRLVCKFKSDTAIASAAPRTGEFNVAQYTKSHDYTPTTDQGQHFYWGSPLGAYANEVIYLYLDNQPDHQVGGGAVNVTYDPEWNAADSFAPTPTRLMDGLTRFYIQWIRPINSTLYLDDWWFEVTDEGSEPFAQVTTDGGGTTTLFKLVSSVGVTYDGASGKYVLTWNGPKYVSQQYRIAYKTTPFKDNGAAWSAGTWDGTTVTANGDAYNGCRWVSPALARGTYYFAIKPIGSNNPRAYFTEVPYIALTAVAPTITSASSTSFGIGVVGSFQVTATGNPTPTFSKTGSLPSGVTFSAAGLLSGTPGAGTAGTYPITITATNGVAPDATQSFTLTVNGTAPVITSANHATFKIGTAGSFAVTATGSPTITFSKTGSLPSGVTLASNGTLSGTPGAATSGNYTITITATNGIAPDATQTFTLTVLGLAPAITSTNATTFQVGVAGSFTVKATGDPTPTFSESGSLPTGVSFNTTTGVLSGTPATGQQGTYALTITATNGVSPDATQSFTLTVTPAAVPPTITSANATTFTEGTAGSFQVTATGDPTITFSKTGSLPSGVTFSSTGLLSGTPAASTAGSYPITITATNGVSPDATQAFTLTVAASGVAPVITSAATTTFTAGASNSFSVTATGSPSPTFSKTGSLPSGVTLASTGLLSGTPASGTGGAYVITITAANGTLPNATQTFTLVVNESPDITSAAQTTFGVGQAGSFQVTATGYPAPTFSKSGSLPSGVTFTSAGLLSGTPAAGTQGDYPLTITATNNVSPDDTQDFTLTVLGSGPTFLNANRATFVKGQSNSFSFITNGVPTPTFSKIAGSLPSGVTLSSEGILSGTPTVSGTFYFTVQATNSAGSATQAFTLTVRKGRGKLIKTG